MDIAVHQGMALDLETKIKNMSDLCKISKIEEMLSNCLENLPDESPLDLIGELNKNDIMH